MEKGIEAPMQVSPLGFEVPIGHWHTNMYLSERKYTNQMKPPPSTKLAGIHFCLSVFDTRLDVLQPTFWSSLIDYMNNANLTFILLNSLVQLYPFFLIPSIVIALFRTSKRILQMHHS